MIECGKGDNESLTDNEKGNSEKEMIMTLKFLFKKY